MSASSALDAPRGASDEPMSKPGPSDDDGMRPEYDFSKGVRGKHAAAYRRARRLAVLDPDVAKVFADDKAVNDALRALATVARAQVPRKRK